MTNSLNNSVNTSTRTIAPVAIFASADSQGLSSFLKVANAAPILSSEREIALATDFRNNNNLDSAKELIVSHLRYVIRVAKGFTGYGLPIADLVQEGNIGLMKAVKSFDPERGVRLVSFATHWIKAEIYDYVIRNWKIVKVATTKAQRKLFFNLRKERKGLATLTKQATHDLAEKLNVPVKTVREMEVRLTGKDVAFDFGSDDTEEFSASPAGYLPDNKYNPEAIVTERSETKSRNESLNSAIKTLDERSKDILQRRWLSDEKTTLTELAEEYGVSAERIRQIEKVAMDKIKNQLQA